MKVFRPFALGLMLLLGCGVLSASFGFTTLAQRLMAVGGSPPPTTTTWNPSDKDPGVTLSGGNLVATSSLSLPSCSTSGYCGVRAVANHTTGKFYYEEVFTNLGGGAADQCLGIADSTASLGNNMPNQHDHATSLCASSGTIENFSSGGTCTSPGVFTSGDTVQVAVDAGATLIWFRINSGNWNGNAGSNPATGSLGCNLSSTLSGAIFPETQGSNDTVVSMTANFGGSAYSFTPPAGFGNW